MPIFEALMKPEKNFLKHWGKASLEELIDCPYQPGNLKILKQGCLARIKVSPKYDFQNRFRNDRNELFHYSVQQGLLICQGCPVKEILPDPPPDSKSARLRLKNNSSLSFHEFS
jgi:hypothetical protein